MMPTTIDCPPVGYWNSNPYSVSFSPDGAKLAIGSGGWYGNGGISLVDLTNGTDTTWRFLGTGGMRLLDVGPSAPFDWGDAPLTVSGVAFDGAGQFLAASTWSSKHRAGPTLLFRVSGHALHYHSSYAPGKGTSTGLCFTPGALVVRHDLATWAPDLSDIFQTHPMPAEVDTNIAHSHRSHARVTLIGGEVITGGRGRGRQIFSDSQGLTGLVVGQSARHVPASEKRITAVLGLPDGRLLTGTHEGELIVWERDTEWQPARVLSGTGTTTSIFGLCALDDGRFFSVSTTGELIEWQDEAVAHVHDLALPLSVSPRCLAVHPDTPHGPMLAIGLKQHHAWEELSMQETRGHVAIVPIERH